MLENDVCAFNFVVYFFLLKKQIKLGFILLILSVNIKWSILAEKHSICHIEKLLFLEGFEVTLQIPVKAMLTTLVSRKNAKNRFTYGSTHGIPKYYFTSRGICY